MRKKTTILILAVVLLYLTFFVGLGVSLYSFLDEQFNQDVNSKYSIEDKNVVKQIETRLNRDYEYFETLTVEYENDELNGQSIPIFNQEYLGFGMIAEEGFLFEDGTTKMYLPGVEVGYYTQEKSIFKLKDLFKDETDEKTYIFFVEEDRFGYFLAETYLNGLITNKQFVLTSPSGLIHYNGFDNKTINNLNNYFEDVTPISEALNKGENGSNIGETVDGKMFAFYTSIESIEGLYFLSTISYASLMNYADRIMSPLLVGFLVTIALVLLLSLFFGIMFTSYYRDLEISKTAQDFSIVSILRITKKGKILYRNKQYKRNFPSGYKPSNILDIFEVNLLELMKQAPQVVTLIKKDLPYSGARLIPLKTRPFSYTILVYPFLTGGGALEEVLKTSSGLPSLNQYKYDFEKVKNPSRPYSKTQAVAVIKIINLRTIESMRGPNYVDLALSNAAKRLKALLDKKISVKLYQTFDDNFVLFYENEDFINVQADIRRIIMSFEQERLMSDLDIKFNLKGGVYSFHYKTERSSAVAVYEKAKMASDKLDAKSNAVLSIYDATDDIILKRNEEIAKDLEVGIEKREFEMYLQAQYNLDTKKIIGFEALLRWNHPKYEKMSPQVYVEVAEQSDAIVRLGELIVEETIKLAKKFEMYDVSISINISGLQIVQVGFVNMVKGFLRQYGVDPKRIVIEITETAIINYFGDVIEKIKMLQDMGMKIHIDDFGTGNSSLLYLKELPVDALKIDREFVKDILTDKYSKAIVGMIINLAKNLDMDIVAEGIENAEYSDFLHKRGVKYIQGYYISRPVPYQDALSLLIGTNKLR